MANFSLERVQDFEISNHGLWRCISIDNRDDWFIMSVSKGEQFCSLLDRSNFDACLRSLGGEQYKLVEVHRFGHMSAGPLKIIVHPSLEDKCAEIEAALESYPALDEQDLSRREWEELEEHWDWFGRHYFSLFLKKQFNLSDDLAYWAGSYIELSDLGRDVFPNVPGLYSGISRVDDFDDECERFIKDPLFTRQVCGQWLRRIRRRIEAEKIQQLELAV